MPRGPQGQKRPADAIGCAIMVGRLATGELTEILNQKSGRVRSGVAGAKARMKSTTKEHRKEIAVKASAERWK